MAMKVENLVAVLEGRLVRRAIRRFGGGSGAGGMRERGFCGAFSPSTPNLVNAA
jgi:hypothetical protein